MKPKTWIYALAGYGIALLLAETELAPIAVVTSWGVAIVMMIDLAHNRGTVDTVLTSLSPSTPPTGVQQ